MLLVEDTYWVVVFTKDEKLIEGKNYFFYETTEDYLEAVLFYDEAIILECGDGNAN
jgi:hypothetical protein